LECRGRRRLMTMELRRRRWTTMNGMEKKEVGEDRWNGEGSRGRWEWRMWCNTDGIEKVVEDG